MNFFTKSLVIALLLSISFKLLSAIPPKEFNEAANTFLSSHVKDGKVDYKNLKANFQEIDQLYRKLATVVLAGTTKEQKMAFYINAYNIIVIREISKYYPIKSALDKNGFFDKERHQVAGESLTLDQVEKGKVIIPYKDPRVHFAFSCAANGCPELANFAFTAENLDSKLDERTRRVLNDPSFIIIDDANKEAKISMLFKWYQNDFKLAEPTVLAYINKYKDQPIPASYSISHYPYNWDLNAR